MREIENAQDVHELVQTFYKKVMSDEVIGPFFKGINLEEHLPKMEFFPPVNESQRELGWKVLKFKKEGFAYFIYEPKDDFLNMNYEEIVSPIEKHFKIDFNNFMSFKDVVKEWLSKEYDINGVKVVR